MRRPERLLLSKRESTAWGVAAVAIAAGGFLWPLGRVLALGVEGGAVRDPEVLRVLFNTVALSLFVGAVALFLGAPLGWTLRSSREAALWLLPASLPSWMGAMGIVGWFGAAGWLVRLGLDSRTPYGWVGVGLAQCAWAVPWTALAVAQARERIPARSLEAAETLGGRRFQVWRGIVIPSAWPSTRVAVAQVLLWSSASYGAVAVLGGGPPVRTLETALLESVRLEGALDGRWAAACALWQALWMGGVAAWGLRGAVAAGEGGDERSFARPRWWVGPLGLWALWPVLGSLSGLGRILSDAAARASLAESAGYSAGVAAASAALSTGAAAVFVVAAASFPDRSGARRALLALASAPSAVSAMVLALGFWMAWGARPALLPIVQAVVLWPLGARALWERAESRSRAQWEAAATLGAGFSRAWFALEWPRWRGALGSVAALTAIGSFGELSAASLIGGEREPFAVLVARWMGQHRIAEAEAACALLFLGAVAALIGVGRLRA